MTDGRVDDLRTRIAKVLHERFGPSLGAHPDGWDREPGHSREMYLEDADAVIRELGLRREYGHLNHEDSGRLYDTLKEAHTHQALRGETLRTRLISDWTDVPTG